MGIKDNLFVIIPIYNAEKYIVEAVKSLIDEYYYDDFFELKVILVNDGSKDNSHNICKLLQEQYQTIIIYLEQFNQGVSMARNTALHYIYENYDISNSWIGFLDADDVWEKGWSQLIKNNVENKYNVLGFGMEICNQDLVRINEIKNEIRILNGGYESSIAENRHSTFGSYIYNANFLRKNNIYFIPKVTNGEDLMFKYQVFLMLEQMKYCDGILYKYRINESSVTQNYSKDAISYYNSFFLAWKGLLAWLIKQDGKESDIAKMIKYAKLKNNYSCMYAARNFCKWSNGSYKKFILEIDRLFSANYSNDVLLEDVILLKDYNFLKMSPLLFYFKYTIIGKFENVKEKLKNVYKSIRL